MTGRCLRWRDDCPGIPPRHRPRPECLMLGEDPDQATNPWTCGN